MFFCQHKAREKMAFVSVYISTRVMHIVRARASPCVCVMAGDSVKCAAKRGRGGVCVFGVRVSVALCCACRDLSCLGPSVLAHVLQLHPHRRRFSPVYLCTSSDTPRSGLPVCTKGRVDSTSCTSMYNSLGMTA